jgi:hypothetical protein
MSTLRSLNEYRNNLAHSALVFDLDAFFDEDTMKWMSTRWTPGGHKQLEIDLGETKDRVTTARIASVWLFRLADQVAQAEDRRLSAGLDWQQILSDHDDGVWRVSSALADELMTRGPLPPSGDSD